MSNKIKIFFVVCSFFFATQAYGWKVDTHVWIGQQVLNDVLPDGNVTIDFGSGVVRDFPVDPAIVEALRNNQDTFRMGNIGPDTFPDMYTGQFAVHPGRFLDLKPDATLGLQTDDWLKFLLDTPNKTPEQTAFIYGYMGHAAADVFAHTYVNQYSGSIFEVQREITADGQSCDDAFVEETRHIEMEKYIGAYNPLMLDVNGQDLGQPKDLVAWPTTFLRDKLIFNDEVAQMNTTNEAYHLALVHELRKNLTGAFEDELRQMDIRATQIGVYWASCEYLGYCILLSDEEAGQVYDEAQRWNTAINDALPTDEAQIAVNAYYDFVRQTVNVAVESEQIVLQAISDIARYTTRINYLTTNVLVAKQTELDGVLRDIIDTAETICKLVCPPPVCEPLTGICVDLPCDKVCETNPAYTKLIKERNRLTKEITNFNAEITEVLEPALQTAIETRRQELEATRTVFINAIGIDQAVFNASVDTVQIITSDLNVIRALRDNWVKDIEDGMAAYIDTNGNIGRAMMDPNVKSLDLLNNWQSCWLLAITGGVPSTITNATCTVTNNVQNIQDALQGFEDYLMTLTDLTSEILRLKIFFTEQIKTLAQKLSDKLVTTVTGCDVENIRKLVDGEAARSPTFETRLTGIFGQDLSSNKHKGLLEIPDIVDRLQFDMGVKPDMYGNDQFDIDKFNAMYNSVVLAKLSLLGAAELNKLDSSVRSTPDLYTGNNHILVGAIRSIDGNHQWLKYAPPDPKRAGYRDIGWYNYQRSIDIAWDRRSYGYSADDAGRGGFKLWSDCSARKNVFQKIFHAPMEPGLESVVIDEYGTPMFGPLLPTDYPYVYDSNNPGAFPHPTNTQTTIGGAWSMLSATDTCRGYNYTVNAPVGGGWHSTILLGNGAVWSWGGGSQGQLGNNNLGTGTVSFTPVQVIAPADGNGFLAGVTAVTTGGSHTLALRSGGTVLAWGDNLAGQLGNNNPQIDSAIPVLVCDSGEIVPCTIGLSNVAAIASGRYHSLALKSDGTVWSWGGGSQGQLGQGEGKLGTGTNSFTPAQVVYRYRVFIPAGGSYSKYSPLRSVTAIASGWSHSLALKSDGTVWTWGDNDVGQLGYNGPLNDTPYAVEVPVDYNLNNGFYLTGVVAIASGRWHSLALKNNGTVWAWGGNSQGQVGNGTTITGSLAVQVVGLADVVAIAGGRQHSIALKRDGTVWAWGYNNVGQLGNGTRTHSTTPVQVLNQDGTGPLTGIAAIGSGQYHSFALQRDGTVWAWGGNSVGQLGIGTAFASGISTPVPVRRLPAGWISP